MSNIDLDVKTVMLQEERTLRELQELKEGMNKLLSMVVTHDELPEWLTLEQCVALKGGCALNTIKCNQFLMPGANLPQFQRYWGNRRVFSRECVLEWIGITDDKLLDYLTNICGITHIPDKFRKKLEIAANRQKQSVPVPQETAICI